MIWPWSIVRAEGRYAANALVLPSLDMFSNLAPAHAPSLISHLTEHNVPGMWSHWRGRYGLTEDQQSELWSLVDPSRPAPQNSSSTTPQQQEKQRVGLKFKTWEGEFLEVEAQEGETLLEVAKKHDLPSMEGTCGGNLGELNPSYYSHDRVISMLEFCPVPCCLLPGRRY